MNLNPKVVRLRELLDSLSQEPVDNLVGLLEELQFVTNNLAVEVESLNAQLHGFNAKKKALPKPKKRTPQQRDIVRQISTAISQRSRAKNEILDPLSSCREALEKLAREDTYTMQVMQLVVELLKYAGRRSNLKTSSETINAIKRHEVMNDFLRLLTVSVCRMLQLTKTRTHAQTGEGDVNAFVEIFSKLVLQDERGQIDNPNGMDLWILHYMTACYPVFFVPSILDFTPVTAYRQLTLCKNMDLSEDGTGNSSDAAAVLTSLMNHLVSCYPQHCTKRCEKLLNDYIRTCLRDRSKDKEEKNPEDSSFNLFSLCFLFASCPSLVSRCSTFLIRRFDAKMVATLFQAENETHFSTFPNPSCRIQDWIEQITMNCLEQSGDLLLHMLTVLHDLTSNCDNALLRTASMEICEAMINGLQTGVIKEGDITDTDRGLRTEDDEKFDQRKANLSKYITEICRLVRTSSGESLWALQLIQLICTFKEKYAHVTLQYFLERSDTKSLNIFFTLLDSCFEMYQNITARVLYSVLSSTKRNPKNFPRVLKGSTTVLFHIKQKSSLEEQPMMIAQQLIPALFKLLQHDSQTVVMEVVNLLRECCNLAASQKNIKASPGLLLIQDYEITSNLVDQYYKLAKRKKSDDDEFSFVLNQLKDIVVNLCRSSRGCYSMAIEAAMFHCLHGDTPEDSSGLVRLPILSRFSKPGTFPSVDAGSVFPGEMNTSVSNKRSASPVRLKLRPKKKQKLRENVENSRPSSWTPKKRRTLADVMITHSVSDVVDEKKASEMNPKSYVDIGVAQRCCFDLLQNITKHGGSHCVMGVVAKYLNSMLPFRILAPPYQRAKELLLLPQSNGYDITILNIWNQYPMFIKILQLIYEDPLALAELKTVLYSMLVSAIKFWNTFSATPTIHLPRRSTWIQRSVDVIKLVSKACQLPEEMSRCCLLIGVVAETDTVALLAEVWNFVQTKDEKKLMQIEAAQRKAEQAAVQRKGEQAAAQRKTEQAAAQRKTDQAAAQRKPEQVAAQRKAEQVVAQRKAEQAAQRKTEQAEQATLRKAEQASAHRTHFQKIVRRSLIKNVVKAGHLYPLFFNELSNKNMYEGVL